MQTHHSPASHRIASHRTAPHRTAPHRTAPQEEAGTFDTDLEASAEADQSIADGFFDLEVLAKKLAATLCVGKAKGPMLTAAVNFLKAGVDVALQVRPV